MIFGKRRKADIAFIEVKDLKALERAGLLWAGQGWAGVFLSTGQ